MVENGFFIIWSVVKTLGYFILGLIDILFRLICREWQRALFNLGLVLSWFIACGCVYPVIHGMLYPTIHFGVLYVYFCIQGHRLLFGGGN
jgi:hypothetical protein